MKFPASENRTYSMQESDFILVKVHLRERLIELRLPPEWLQAINYHDLFSISGQKQLVGASLLAGSVVFNVVAL